MICSLTIRTSGPEIVRAGGISRRVPSVLDVAITGPDGVLPEWVVPSPNRRGGYQLDARRDTLQAQR
jgi:hypothetical protein